MGGKVILRTNPANIFTFKVTNRDTRKMCEICSKLKIKTPELLIYYSTPFSSVSIVEFEQVNVSWVLFFCWKTV